MSIDFIHISQYVEFILMLISIDLMFHISIKKMIIKIPLILLWTYIGFYYFISPLIAMHYVPLNYYFYYDISVILIVLLFIYSLWFRENILNNVVYCVFLVFNSLFIKTVLIYLGSVFVESASFLVNSEGSIFYYFIPFIEFIIMMFEWYFIQYIPHKINQYLGIILTVLLLIEIYLMCVLGYMYVEKDYQSTYMLMNVLLMCILFFIFIIFMYYVKKYYELQASQQVYMESMKYHRDYDNIIKKKCSQIQKFQHDFKYYLLEMKKVAQQKETINQFLNRIEEMDMIYSYQTLLQYLFHQKKEKANQKEIDLSIIVQGDYPLWIKEYDFYYLLDIILDAFIEQNVKDIQCIIKYHEAIQVMITSQDILKKYQDKILIQIEPVLKQYHGYACFQNQHHQLIFIMNLCHFTEKK